MFLNDWHKNNIGFNVINVKSNIVKTEYLTFIFTIAYAQWQLNFEYVSQWR
jgi:hypothetical protein